ncbi:hypothetical protein [Desulfocurvus sp. DL9XJH121]
MKKSLLLLLVAALPGGCADRGTGLEIDSSHANMPRDVAISYLQNESVKFSPTMPCHFTNNGVLGVPYEDIVFYGHSGLERMIFIIPLYEGAKSGGTYLCRAVEYNAWYSDYGTDEYVDVMNKTVTALVSLGAREVGGGAYGAKKETRTVDQ